MANKDIDNTSPYDSFFLVLRNFFVIFCFYLVFQIAEEISGWPIGVFGWPVMFLVGLVLAKESK